MPGKKSLNKANDSGSRDFLSDRKDTHQLLESMHDWLKHIATLDTVAILFMGAFWSKLNSSEWKLLLVFSFVALFVSLIGIVWARYQCLKLQFLIFAFLSEEDTDSGEDFDRQLNKRCKYLGRSSRLAGGSFSFGFLLLVVFAIRNLF